MFQSPSNEGELLERAHALAGLNLAEVALLAQTQCPSDMRRAKGWLGQTIETILGAESGSKALPDFASLGIELKTLPLNQLGQPIESTYVTYAPIPFEESTWKQSLVFKKLHRVLWVPFLGEGPIGSRLIATPFLWTLPPAIDAMLEQDWNELSMLLKLQHFDRIHGGIGQALHLRPKAADSKTFIRVLNDKNEWISVVPKGFYLRNSFTKKLLEAHF